MSDEVEIVVVSSEPPGGQSRYAAYIASDAWALQRESAFLRWGRHCNSCGRTGKLHVHHLFYRNLYNCVDNDLMPLCERCHTRVHERGLSYSVSEEGDHFDKRRLTLKKIARLPRADRRDPKRKTRRLFFHPLLH